MIGSVRDIYRDRSTLELASSPGEGMQRYVAFEGFAVVNVGPKPAEGADAEKSAAPTTRTRRSRGR